MNTPVYISNGGEALGPYEISQLRSMWSTGQIAANTLYWHEEKQAWCGIAELRLGEIGAQPVARPETTCQPAATQAEDTAVASKPDSINATQWALVFGVIGFFVWIYVDTMWGKHWILWLGVPLLLVGIFVLAHVLWGGFLLAGMKLSDGEFWRTNKLKASALLVLVVGIFVLIQIPERILGEDFMLEHGMKAVYAVVAVGAIVTGSLVWTMLRGKREKA
jgi:hypothetical protein